MIQHINKLKNKNDHISSRKNFHKIQHTFMIKKKKTLQSEHERKLSQHNKGHIWQTKLEISCKDE